MRSSYSKVKRRYRSKAPSLRLRWLWRLTTRRRPHSGHGILACCEQRNGTTSEILDQFKRCFQAGESFKKKKASVKNKSLIAFLLMLTVLLNQAFICNSLVCLPTFWIEFVYNTIRFFGFNHPTYKTRHQHLLLSDIFLVHFRKDNRINNDVLAQIPFTYGKNTPTFNTVDTIHMKDYK